MELDVVKAILPGIVAFWIGIALAPFLSHYLYAFQVWKKKGGKTALDGTAAVEFGKLHAVNETRTPRMGGILIWSSVLATTSLFWILAYLMPQSSSAKLDFLSRSQTWLPLFTLLAGGIVGFINDVLDVTSTSGDGLRLRTRLIFVVTLSAFIGWWFYDKLDIVSIAIPFGGELYLGALIIPFFIFVSVSLYASGVIDGIDGLSGGVFASIFTAYALIAFNGGQIDLAAFSASVAGAILAFLWFNVPPARFWMTETGTMGITLTIAPLAFLTDTLGEGHGVLMLPIIAFLLVVTVASNVLQIFWKKMFKKKLFRIAPLHHHFEAIGWPGYKVTMRYWILSIICAILGVVLALVA